MFKDSASASDNFSVGTVSESWAFILQWLCGNIPILRLNNPIEFHLVYGMGFSPLAYTELNSAAALSKLWLISACIDVVGSGLKTNRINYH